MARVLVTVVEVDPFSTTADRVGLAEDERLTLTAFLAANREAGDVIPGTGGLRKLRWAGKGKGRRGGYRIIYYYFNDGVPLYLLAIYAKNVQIDLTPQQKKRLSELAKQLKAAAKAEVPRRVAR